MTRHSVHVSADGDELPVGWWLMIDTEDGECAVYLSTEEHDQMFVSWQGAVGTNGLGSKEWSKTLVGFRLSPQEADVAIMAARHFRTPGQWYAYARGVAEKEDIFT